MEKSNIDIIIVNWNAGEMLHACVQSVLSNKSDNLNINVIIVDNNSSDNSITLLPIINSIQIIKNSSNTGFAAACNQGYSISKSDFVLLLNPDTILPPNTLYDCIEFIKNHSEIAILGVKQYFDTNQVMKTCSRFPNFKNLSNYIFLIIDSFNVPFKKTFTRIKSMFFTIESYRINSI